MDLEENFCGPRQGGLRMTGSGEQGEMKASLGNLTSLFEADSGAVRWRIRLIKSRQGAVTGQCSARIQPENTHTHKAKPGVSDPRVHTTTKTALLSFKADEKQKASRPERVLCFKRPYATRIKRCTSSSPLPQAK